MPDLRGRETERAPADVLALVRSRVRIRFTLTAEQFAQLLLTRAREAGFAGDPAAWVRLLSLDDLYLAQACAHRDEHAWAECSNVHLGFMREFAARFLRADDAVELTGRVFADLWEKRKLAGYEGRSTLRTWLGTVVANAAIQAGKVIRRREEAAQSEAAAGAQAPAVAPEDREAAKLLAQVTSEAIEALPRDGKLLLLLHYEQDLSLDEMAPMLDTSKATLSRRLKRLREDIRATIERLAFQKYRTTAADVRARLDLGRIDLDLSALLSNGGAVKGNGGNGV